MYGEAAFDKRQVSVLRLMLREEMREAKVDGFIPSNSAAPPGPETFPFVCFKALMMASRSWRFSWSRVRSAALAAGFACSPLFLWGREAGKSKVSGPSCHKMMARSTVFCSSRTLPGQ